MKSLEKYFDRFDRVARKNVERWMSAAERVQSNAYKLDSTIGLMDDDERVVVVKIVVGLDEAHGTEKVSVTGGGSPAATDLVLQKNPDPNVPPTLKIPATNPGPNDPGPIKVKLSANGKTLAVKISNVDKLVAKAGTVYGGKVLLNNVEIATIQAIVKA
jgi:hypothetical protein